MDVMSDMFDVFKVRPTNFRVQGRFGRFLHDAALSRRPGVAELGGVAEVTRSRCQGVADLGVSDVNIHD